MMYVILGLDLTLQLVAAQADSPGIILNINAPTETFTYTCTMTLSQPVYPKQSMYSIFTYMNGWFFMVFM